MKLSSFRMRLQATVGSNYDETPDKGWIGWSGCFVNTVLQHGLEGYPVRIMQASGLLANAHLGYQFMVY